MGSTSSLNIEGVELVPQIHKVVALPPDVLGSSCRPLVLSSATKLRVEHYPHKDLSIFDYVTGELLFRYDDKSSREWTERMLVDGHSKPVVGMTKKLVYHRNYILHAPEDSSDVTTSSNSHSKQQQKYELTSAMVHWVLKMELKLIDQTSGEKLTVQVDGNWKARAVVLWVVRRGSGAWHKEKQREPIGTITWTQNPAGYDVDVAAGVDLTIVALFAVVLYETVTDFPVFSGSH